MDGMNLTRSTSKGTCSYCGGSYAKAAISRHLKACPARTEENDAPAGKSSGRGQARFIYQMRRLWQAGHGGCCVCSGESTGRVCDECGKTHECGEDMLLPVVNSPRVGMCDYTGGYYD
ncbi:MAG: hypothetical protein PHF80_06615 [Methanothrix sp.]|nr:hypothetical protein [Methanothrix sp.]